MKATALCIGLAATLAGAGCGSSSSSRQGLDSLIPEVPGVTARLRSPSSAATGVVHVFDYKGGVQVQLTIANLMPGAYRIAFHETANCRSPNLFSAGKAWAPPSFTGNPGELMPAFTTSPDGGTSDYVAFVKGVSVDGPVSLRGKSVVIHWGDIVGEAFPGQPSNRIACGVFEASKPLL
ncbi:MAG: superoxide dismutase family protein [Burkholderiales bacterium]|nr:superoxide dismutase family protein [Burkholderiales bacterium]